MEPISFKTLPLEARRYAVRIDGCPSGITVKRYRTKLQGNVWTAVHPNGTSATHLSRMSAVTCLLQLQEGLRR